MKKKENREVGIKNYILIFVISLGVILFAIYIFQWIKVYNTNKDIEESPLTKTTYEIQYEELNNVFAESSDDYFIFISYNNDKKVTKLEKKVKKFIIENNLENNMYYLNVTELKNQENFISELNSKMNLVETKIKKLPAIVYYKDKKVEKVLDDFKDLKELQEIVAHNEID